MINYMEKLFGMKGKTVVVTGAIGQLGTKICNAYKEAGAAVIGLDIDTSHNTLEGINYYDLDITKKNNVLQVFEDIIGKFSSFDILINNAGIGVFEPFKEREEHAFDKVASVNLKGTFFCIQSYVNLFEKYKLNKGAIVNIASMYGVISSDFRIYTDCARMNSEVYSATKAGVIQMTKYFAVHLADKNIRVNAVSPGGIYNPAKPQGDDFIKNYSFRCPMKRMANDEEMIGAIIYLSSPAASYTTGHNIIIDGGMSSW